MPNLPILGSEELRGQMWFLGVNHVCFCRNKQQLAIKRSPFVEHFTVNKGVEEFNDNVPVLEYDATANKSMTVTMLLLCHCCITVIIEKSL